MADSLTTIHKHATDLHILWSKAHCKPTDRERMKGLRKLLAQAWHDRRLERCLQSTHPEWSAVTMSTSGGLRPCEDTVIGRLGTHRLTLLRELWQETTAEAEESRCRVA